MPQETSGEPAKLYTADHPPRTDSPEYIASRTWLTTQAMGGCVICGGESDLTHPGSVEPAAGILQDHHGGGIYVVPKGTNEPVLVGLNLFPIEWSEGWGADPTTIARRVGGLNALLGLLGQPTYTTAIDTTADVMAYVDSVFNANIKLCAAHHIALEEKNTKDANGHQAVGIHSIPFPIWAYQGYCDWAKWDMWAGTTGTIAVAPDPTTGGGTVLHVSQSARARSPKNAAENARLVRAWYGGKRDIRLPPDHNLVVAARKGAG
jgi:hypothetical protein